MKKILFFLFSLFSTQGLWAQMRFPKPEFSNGYIVPEMVIESTIPDHTLWRLVLLAGMLILTGVMLYRFRSRPLLTACAAANLILFGFLWGGCVCPIGLIQQTACALYDSSAPYTVAFGILFTLPLIAALWFGRLFCMGGCPLGAFQELLQIKTLRVPYSVDRLLRFVPLWILATGSVLAMSGAGYWLCILDPYVNFFHRGGNLFALVFGLVMVILGLFISRPFCRWLCPYGVLLKAATVLSRWRVKIPKGDCVQCRLCETACPNGAILPPAPPRPENDVRTEIKRIQWLVASLPFILLAGGFCGWSAGSFFAGLHFEVTLLADLKAGTVNDAVNAFLSSGTPISTLEYQAAETTLFIQRGLAIGWGIIAGVTALTFLRDLRLRTEKDYTVDAPNCFACGRCYPSCPINRLPGGEK